ncbi:MAG: hypothetical protein EOO54_09265 [Haliea sp.]|nr:MAG: hypothetical protein EOO54_09265 [Haliea sp.]
MTFALLFLPAGGIWADQATDTAPGGQPNRAVTARADLDFILNIGKFIFFRVGTGAFPTASGTVDTVAFDAVPTIPAGTGTTVVWSGALPSFTAGATSLPVEVRSNTGQISIRATATTLLNSGANNIPLSQIVLTSSDANLPAPLIPDAGTGPAVNVAATGFANLVTVRNANWTFAYNPLVTQRAGVYTGQISFTASSP